MKSEHAFPTNYISSTDVEDAGGSMQLTIDEVEMQKLQDGQSKPVVIWQQNEKPLILNKTNFRTMAKIADEPDTDDWHGTVVELFVAQVEFKGETVPGIRIRAPRKKTGRKKADVKPPEDAADVGFAPPSHPANDAFGDDPNDPFA